MGRFLGLVALLAACAPRAAPTGTDPTPPAASEPAPASPAASEPGPDSAASEPGPDSAAPTSASQARVTASWRFLVHPEHPERVHVLQAKLVVDGREQVLHVARVEDCSEGAPEELEGDLEVELFDTVVTFESLSAVTCTLSGGRSATVAFQVERGDVVGHALHLTGLQLHDLPGGEHLLVLPLDPDDEVEVLPTERQPAQEVVTLGWTLRDDRLALLVGERAHPTHRVVRCDAHGQRPEVLPNLSGIRCLDEDGLHTVLALAAQHEAGEEFVAVVIFRPEEDHIESVAHIPLPGWPAIEWAPLPDDFSGALDAD